MRVNHPDVESAHLLQAAEELSRLARDLAPVTEHDRRLATELVAGLRGCGLLRLGAAASFGSAEAPPAVTLRCAETLARGDASAGWCVSINCTSSLLCAYLPAEGAAEVFGSPDTVAAGVWMAGGKARPADGGFRVSGRWAFCSAITHSDYFFGGCVIDRGELSKGGSPSVVGIPTAELEILDTWRTSGLRGTGSHDAVANDVFVPERRFFSLFAPLTIDTPLYRFPVLSFFALSIAAAALGNGRGAIDDLVELARNKKSPHSGRTLATRSATQASVAEADASLRAARALYYQAIEEAWETAQGDEPADEAVSVDQRVGLRLAATHAVRTAANVARAMYDLGGGTAIYEDSRLQRRFRDAHAATAHFQVNPATWELLGKQLLGLQTVTALL